MRKIFVGWIFDDVSVLELLVLGPSHCVACGRNGQTNSNDDQACSHQRKRAPLDNSHGGVKKCPLTISLKPLDKFDKVVA